jgi:hypothetical protein
LSKKFLKFFQPVPIHCLTRLHVDVL